MQLTIFFLVTMNLFQEYFYLFTWKLSSRIGIVKYLVYDKKKSEYEHR